MAIEFLTGQRLTADLLNNNMIGFFPTTYTKDVATSRGSTTTLANDDELTGIPIGVGTWEIEFVGFFYTQFNGAQAIKTRWAIAGGGAWNGSSALRSCIGPGSDNTVGTNVAATMNTRGNTLDSQDSAYRSSNGTTPTQFREICRAVEVTIAGTMSIQWAQLASAVDVTTLAPGSTVTLRKISS